MVVPWSATLVLCTLGCVAAQSTVYQFTVDVTASPPIPGKPFTLTWTGGEPSEAVYITLNNYFPDLPNQNIPYGSTDILSNAPNNGSWTYNVPLNIPAGHHSFAIGYNPFMLSATTAIFIILPSQTSSAGPFPVPINTASVSYDGCGLPPLPDYTYTGYQPPCTVTTSGRVETIYPIVPNSDSSIFWGSTALGSASPTTSSAVPSATVPPTTAFATGVFAQALQCPTPVIPSATQIISDGVTTVISVVSCEPTEIASQSSAGGSGVCHTSGYTTYSVSGTSSVCCPGGWATTPLDSELFCFTSMAATGLKRAALGQKRGQTETLSGLAFTTAGIVTTEAAAAGGSAAAGSGTGTKTSTGTGTSKTNSSNGGARLGMSLWQYPELTAVVGVMYHIIFY